MLAKSINLNTRVLEIRDSMTCLSVLAIRMFSMSDVQDWHIHLRCGYSRDGSSIILVNLDDARAKNSSYDWKDRTMFTAHDYIEKNFDSLNDGDVIDVEFILGETDKKKISERFN
jgi:hypothetical protein